MGFGYLLIGYLVAFLLKITAEALQLGFAALLLGYVLMLFGLWRLKRFCRSFFGAELMLYPLLITVVYHALRAGSETFLWNLPIVSAAVTDAVGWVEFILIMAFHAALLSAIRELAMQVELKSTVSAAIRNSILVLLYAILYLVCKLPIGAMDGVRNYFLLSLTLLNLAFVICNLLLLLSCTKNICAKGEEEPAPKEYKWKFLNRIGEAFDQTLQKATDRQKEEIEDHLRRRNEKKKKKKK